MQAVGTISSEQLQQLQKGTIEWEAKPVKGHARSHVYLVHKGTRHHIQNWNYVKSLGLSGADLLRVEQDKIDTLSEGPPIDSPDALSRILAT